MLCNNDILSFRLWIIWRGWVINGLYKYKQIEEDLADFFRVCHSKHYTVKSTLIRSGDSADTLYYLREGSVTIVMENEEGEEMIVAHLNQDDFIGEIGVFFLKSLIEL